MKLKVLLAILLASLCSASIFLLPAGLPVSGHSLDEIKHFNRPAPEDEASEKFTEERSELVGRNARTGFHSYATELLEFARKGSVSALVEAERIFSLCLMLTHDSVEEMDFTFHADRKALTEHARDFCIGFQYEDSWTLIAINRERLMMADPYALAKHFRTPDSEIDDLGFSAEDMAIWAWEEAMNNADPHTVAALLDMVFNRWDSPAERIGGASDLAKDFHSSSAFINSGELRAREVKRYAFDILACQLGAECGPNGLFQKMHCISFGLCETHLPVDQFISRHLLTEQERSAVRSLTHGFLEISGR